VGLAIRRRVPTRSGRGGNSGRGRIARSDLRRGVRGRGATGTHVARSETNAPVVNGGRSGENAGASDESGQRRCAEGGGRQDDARVICRHRDIINTCQHRPPRSPGGCRSVRPSSSCAFQFFRPPGRSAKRGEHRTRGERTARQGETCCRTSAPAPVARAASCRIDVTIRPRRLRLRLSRSGSCASTPGASPGPRSRDARRRGPVTRPHGRAHADADRTHPLQRG
jgi:hypothetical protein